MQAGWSQTVPQESPPSQRTSFPLYQRELQDTWDTGTWENKILGVVPTRPNACWWKQSRSRPGGQVRGVEVGCSQGGVYQAWGKQLFYSPVKMSTTENCQTLCLLLANDEIKCRPRRNTLNWKQSMRMLHNGSYLGFLFCFEDALSFLCIIFWVIFFSQLVSLNVSLALGLYK